MKNTKLLATFGLALMISISWALAQSPLPKEPEELVRLRQQFAQRRDAALKPVNASYKQQLDLLMKSLTQRNQLDGALSVRKELESLSAPESGEADLKSALLKWKWSWTGGAKETDVFMDFSDDGTVRHRGMNGKWTIIGPHEIRLTENGGRTFVLRFNAGLDSYQSVGPVELHGKRSSK